MEPTAGQGDLHLREVLEPRVLQTFPALPGDTEAGAVGQPHHTPPTPPAPPGANMKPVRSASTTTICRRLRSYQTSTAREICSSATRPRAVASSYSSRVTMYFAPPVAKHAPMPVKRAGYLSQLALPKTVVLT